MRQKFTTKCVSFFITKYNVYYKMRQYTSRKKQLKYIEAPNETRSAIFSVTGSPSSVNRPTLPLPVLLQITLHESTNWIERCYVFHSKIP